MAKRLSKKKELWEVIIPEPFNIDPVLKKEDLIQTMSNFDSVEEMNTFLFECLSPYENRMVVLASEYEIFKSLWNNKNGLKTNIINNDDKFIVVIKDKKNNILGKGEFSRLGDIFKLDDAKEMLSSEMNNFSERYNYIEHFPREKFFNLFLNT